MRIEEAEVLKRCHVPGSHVGPGESLLEMPCHADQYTIRVLQLLIAQALLQREGSHCCRGHPLPVDRVQGANCVTQDHESIGPLWEALIVPEPVLGLPKARDGREGLCALDRIVKYRTGQTLYESQKASLVGWRIVSCCPAHRHDPAITLDGEECATSGAFRRSALHEHVLPVGSKTSGPLVEAAGVSHGCANNRFLWTCVTSRF